MTATASGVEIWADQAALDDHMAHPHTREFLRAAPGLVAGEPTMSLYESAQEPD